MGRLAGGIIGVSVETDMKILLDEATGSITYIGKAPPNSATSSAVWQIKKLDESGTGGIELVLTWADGNKNYDNIWDNRTGYNYS